MKWRLPLQPTKHQVGQRWSDSGEKEEQLQLQPIVVTQNSPMQLGVSALSTVMSLQMRRIGECLDRLSETLNPP